jgi:hypothetical protein
MFSHLPMEDLRETDARPYISAIKSHCYGISK